MRKFLIVLMVVVMASFLFVGCLGTTPPIEPDEPDEPVLPVSEAPYITDIKGIYLLSTATQYISDDEAGKVKVSGVGKTNSIIKVYINDVLAGIGSTGLIGTFEVAISKTALGKEGAKTLYATATESGLAESVPSTSYKFTYDKTAPTITSVVGDASKGYITVKFSEAVKASTVIVATWKYSTSDTSFTTPIVTVVTVVASSTTAKLYEVAALDELDAVWMYLSVKCEGTVTDLAGNEIDEVTVYGYVFE